MSVWHLRLLKLHGEAYTPDADYDQESRLILCSKHISKVTEFIGFDNFRLVLDLLPDDLASTAGLNSVQTRSDHVTNDVITVILVTSPSAGSKQTGVGEVLQVALASRRRLPNLLLGDEFNYGRAK